MTKRIGLLLTLLVLGTSIATAQNEKYKMAMVKNLGEFGKAKTVEDYTRVANKFETIAKKEKSEWLPWYYNGLVNIVASFNAELSKEEKDNLLDKSQIAIDSLREMVPEESEIYALEGFLHLARLVVDPASRGASYGMKINKSCRQSLELNKDNPRAKYLMISNQIGAAQFFGSNTTQLCQQAKDLLNSWDDFQSESKMHPNWGKDELQQIVDSCK